MRLILIFKPVFLCMFTTIKASDSMMIHIPFNIEIDPMECLLLVNFENDPDTLYVGFEPQVFDDHVNGQGHLVIGWRKDGRVDVYHEAGLKPDPAKYDIAGKLSAQFFETDSLKSRCNNQCKATNQALCMISDNFHTDLVLIV